MQNEINIRERINFFKNAAKTYWGKISENDFELAKTKFAEVKELVQSTVSETKSQLKEKSARSKAMNRAAKGPSKEEQTPGVKFTTTENSPMANGAEKVAAYGIDSFGEQETIDPSDIKQESTSELADRYYTPGLHSDKSH